MPQRLPILMLIAALLLIPVLAAAETSPRRPVHTYSIVARDAATGQLGVAVQSHWFSVGTVVSHAEAGVGAVATQSFSEISYGPLGLELMRAGKSAEQALKALTSIDDNQAVRQVAMVDAQGNVSAHTGASCIAEAGHVTGEGYSVQANLMEKSTVPGAMAAAYEAAEGDLAARLLAALDAAQAEGGDIRGMQSAALLVVPGETEGTPWRERSVDLRVDDHPQPLEELRRLLHVHRTYEHMNRGDELLAEEDVEGALREYATAAEMLPEMTEIRYWQAVTMVGVGKVEEALPIFQQVFREDPKWRELTPRLPASGLLPEDEELIRKITQTESR